MCVRLILDDKKWDQIESVLQEIKPKVGAPPNQSDRMFIEAVLYVGRTGIPWRDLPSEFGNFSAVYNRLKRWKRNGTWEKLWKRLGVDELSMAENLLIDSTIIRAHQHAAGAKKENGGQDCQALGRSRGGFSTKIHLGCINETNSISIVLTPGQIADCTGFDSVFEDLPQNHGLKHGIMDKAYDSNAIRETLTQEGMVDVIPSKKNRVEPIAHDEELYKLRNKVERFINRIKQFRRIATRYDKLSSTYLAFLHIVSVYVSVA